MLCCQSARNNITRFRKLSGGLFEILRRLEVSENTMSTISFAPGQKAKTSLRPSRQAIRRAALALAAALGVAGTADFGHYYLTTGRYLETTDDAYIKAAS